MDKADAELTRKAVAEIMKEMQLFKEHEEQPIQERKINPLGRTNKHFLGRTLNAMVRHNKYKDEQTRRRCNKKLRELDEHKYKHYNRRRSISFEHLNERKRSHQSKDTSSDSSESESNSKHRKKHKKSKMKKRKKRHQKSRKNESSSNHSSEQAEENVSTNQYSYEGTEEVDYSSYLMPPTLWDIQMQQFYQYKALMALGAAAAQAASTNTMKIIELHSSSPSLSDIILDESTSDSEEGNGGILTINVTDSDDGKTVNKKVPKKRTKSNNQQDNLSSSIELVESDCISVESSSSAGSTVNAIDLTED